MLKIDQYPLMCIFCTSKNERCMYNSCASTEPARDLGSRLGLLPGVSMLWNQLFSSVHHDIQILMSGNESCFRKNHHYYSIIKFRYSYIKQFKHVLYLVQHLEQRMYKLNDTIYSQNTLDT